MIEASYKNLLLVILFIYIALKIKDFLNNADCVSYLKEKLKILVVGSNSSFLNGTFYKVNKKHFFNQKIKNFNFLFLIFFKLMNDSSDVFELSFKSNENQILGRIMAGIGVIWNSFKVIFI
jgi:hypothetical protein